MNKSPIIFILFIIIIILYLVYMFLQDRLKKNENFSNKINITPIPYTSQFLSIIKDAEKGQISKYLHQQSYEVYSCSCLSPAFIDYFIDQSKKYTSHSPNSMNNYGLVLNDTPLSDFIDRLQKEYLVPLFRLLFPNYKSIKDFHAFTIKYSHNEDYNLDPHTDDSDITFNICLSEPLKGSELVFCGNIDSPDHRKVSTVYKHTKGHAIIHLGKRRHCAVDIINGSRMNLVIWNRYNDKKKNISVSEIGTPDKVCVSYTHDKDYFKYYKTPPKGFKRKQRAPWCCST